MIKKIYAPSLVTLLSRLLIGLLMMGITRYVFYLYNSDLFGEISWQQLLIIFKGGIVFDTSILLLLNSLYILSQIIPFGFKYKSKYQKITLWFYVLPTSLCLLLNIIDAAYYPVTQERTTFQFFSQFQHETNLIRLIMLFIVEYWYLLILTLFFVYILIQINRLIEVQKPKVKPVWLHFSLSVLIAILFCGLTIGGIRGGFTRQTRPITLSNASKYVEKPNQRDLVLNTAFSIYRTIGQSSLEEVTYFDTEEERKRYFSALKIPDTIHHKPFLKKNIVIFILESFGKENIGVLNKEIEGYEGYTPFFDSLILQSFSFKQGISNSRKSISGMPAVLASVPSLENQFVLSLYSGDEIDGLPNLLKQFGYTSAFFHGASNGSMGFDSFAKQLGFESYFGREEYNNEEDFDGYWGIYDEEFFQFFAKQMNVMKQPFVTSVFSVSSHHPYVIPPKHENRFEEDSIKLHRSVRYVDYALKRFFETAKTMEWYKNTLFVFTADHAPTFSYLKEYKNPLGTFAIPLIFYDPSGTIPIELNDSLSVQQTDIVPTVLGYLNYPYKHLSFGKNLLEKKMDRDWAVSYASGEYQIFRRGHLLQFDGINTSGCYNFFNDTNFMHDIRHSMNQELKHDIENKLKSFIQELNYRLINNEMSVIE